MAKPTKDILRKAMELDAADRADLAAELIASLDEEADEDVEIAWAKEIERRIAAIEAGTTTLSPWSDVKQRIEKEILER